MKLFVVNQEYFAQGHPTPYKIAQSIKQNAATGYTYKGATITAAEIKLELDWLYTEIFNSNQEEYENFGLRFYPAFIDGKMGCLMKKTNNHSAFGRSDYWMLEGSRTPSMFKVNRNNAKEYVNEFFSDIMIDGKLRAQGDPYFKKSRYYDWFMLRSYFKANGFVEGASNTGKYALSIQFGLTRPAEADDLYAIYFHQAADKAEDLLGFTVVLELVNDTIGVARDTGVNSTSLTNGIIEIGNPCPPRCKGEGLF